VPAAEKNLEVLPYDDANAEAWDAFLRTATNGTLFHTRAFLNYHPADRFHDDSLFFLKDGKIIAVFPAAIRRDDKANILRSHPGASYGGLVVRSTLSLRDAVRLVQHLVEYAQQRGYAGVEMTLPPQIYYFRPSNYLDFALFQNGFAYRKREVSSVIPLDVPAPLMVELFSSASRRAVRRAEKLGVQVGESDDFAEFYKILKKNLSLRHDVKPAHTLEELKTLKKIFPEKIRLFASRFDGKMIAGIVVFICNERVALAFYVSHDETYQKYRGVNLVFNEAIRWCAEQHFRFLDFGIFTVNMEPNWGLCRFKESFGASGIFRDTLIRQF
jgi:hypothetical protein